MTSREIFRENGGGSGRRAAWGQAVLSVLAVLLMYVLAQMIDDASFASRERDLSALHAEQRSYAQGVQDGRAEVVPNVVAAYSQGKEDALEGYALATRHARTGCTK